VLHHGSLTLAELAAWAHMPSDTSMQYDMAGSLALGTSNVVSDVCWIESADKNAAFDRFGDTVVSKV